MKTTKDPERISSIKSEANRAQELIDSLISDVRMGVKSSSSPEPRLVSEPTRKKGDNLHFKYDKSDLKKALIGVGSIFMVAVFANLMTETHSTKPSGLRESNVSGGSGSPIVPQNRHTSSTATEERPPIGKDRVLNKAEIRYCLFEDARLEVMRDQVTKELVPAFNAAVNDYNSRCGEYRYRKSDLEQVTAEVKSSESRVQLQAAARLERWRSLGEN